MAVLSDDELTCGEILITGAQARLSIRAESLVHARRVGAWSARDPS
jgi:hypothetical protein